MSLLRWVGDAGERRLHNPTRKDMMEREQMYSRLEETNGTGVKGRLAAVAHRLGVLRWGRPLWRRSLTVVNYHRIEDVERPGFDSFKPNVSADPVDFERQVQYLRRWFHVISIEQLAAWLESRGELPEHAALITFDDGYMDNYTRAFPILQKYELPALIFLAAGHIGTDEPFYWDLAAYCFHHTNKERVTFPDGTERAWKGRDDQEAACKAWVEAVKPLPEDEKAEWVRRLPGELGVAVPEGFFRSLMMGWEQVREMRAGGIGFGGHTLSHPILTRIPLEQARAEIVGSKQRIESELGKPVLAFAYPNGMASDLNGALEDIVAQAGYRAGFTLLNGPASWREVKQKPYAIRRVFISHKHTLPQFAALVSPWNRLRGD